jgi:hypothetical protein
MRLLAMRGCWGEQGAGPGRADKEGRRTSADDFDHFALPWTVTRERALHLSMHRKRGY